MSDSEPTVRACPLFVFHLKLCIIWFRLLFDVFFLYFQVQLLQQQVTSLADTQSTVDDRYTRAKSENAVLQARVHALEEQLRDVSEGSLRNNFIA